MPGRGNGFGKVRECILERRAERGAIFGGVCRWEAIDRSPEGECQIL